MISETLLRALQERMRKLTGASSTYAVRNAELRAAVERARLSEATEVVRQTETVRESERLMEEIKELRDHINDLVRSREDPALISRLKAELAELESRRHEIDQQIEQSSRIVTRLSKTPSKNSSPRSSNTDTSPTKR